MYISHIRNVYQATDHALLFRLCNFPVNMTKWAPYGSQVGILMEPVWIAYTEPNQICPWAPNGSHVGQPKWAAHLALTWSPRTNFVGSHMGSPLGSHIVY